MTARQSFCDGFAAEDPLQSDRAIFPIGEGANPVTLPRRMPASGFCFWRAGNGETPENQNPEIPHEYAQRRKIGPEGPDGRYCWPCRDFSTTAPGKPSASNHPVSGYGCARTTHLYAYCRIWGNPLNKASYGWPSPQNPENDCHRTRVRTIRLLKLPITHDRKHR